MTRVNIPDDILEEAKRISHIESAEELVIRALQEFAARHDQRKLIPLLGTFDSIMTPEELDEMRRME